MIQKRIIGTPINTEAVVKVIEDGYRAWDKLMVTDKLPQMLSVCIDENKNQIVISYDMDKDDIVYGLGESMRGINKRGYIYHSLCADDPNHTEDKVSLYGAHNFLVVQGKENFGLFVDCPGKVIFDIGYTSSSKLEITCESKDANLYYLTGNTPMEIVKEFRELIGRSYIPPKWGMGFGQCRWSYMDENEVTTVADGYQNNGIPVDSIYLDIDYMEAYKDFTLHKERFPEFEDFVHKMKDRGIRLVPIIDAGVKIEKGYDVYEEGVSNDYFCKDEDGNDYVAGVWPGKVHFPDVLNSDVRKWFGEKYRFLTDKGIEGFWNDMNEPAIFYSEKHLKEVFEKIEEYKSKELDIEEFFAFTGMVAGLSNRHKDYETFYHNMDGQKIRHDLVHNLYGFNMTRAAGEALEKIKPHKRMLLFSRASYIGMHRYGGIWTGDNQSWWSHILLSMKQMVGLNMCGFLFVGSDIGGFGSNVTEDLALRFTQWGMFTPLMRNHSAAGTRRQEAYAFERTEDFKNMIRLRYFFLPYLYSEYMKAALRGDMYFRPLAWEFPDDKHATQVEDQLMIGENMMIAPVYTQNATGRYVYLPEEMKMYRFRSPMDVDVDILEKGHHYVECALNEVLVFVRQCSIIPCAGNAMSKEMKNTDTLDDKNLILLVNPNILNGEFKAVEYEMYSDDGFTKDYENPKNLRKITMRDGEILRGKRIN